jgi:NADH-quinone oxidoreductase subunit F
MAVEGRTHRPVIDYEKCDTCGVCLYACPAEIMPEMREEADSLRGKIYDHFDADVSPYGKKDLLAPPCQLGCPIRQDVRGYMKLIAEKRHREALELIRKANPLPSVCGYVCHHPCQDACTRVYVDDALSIRSLKRFAADFDNGDLTPPEIGASKGKKVAVIGSGPAGLTAAHELARNGYGVEIVESYSVPGGMLAWAIPSFRLPEAALRRDIDYIRKMGVVIRTETRFGVDVTASDLRADGVEAIIIATGTPLGLKMNIENETDAEGYFDCLAFLRKYADGQLVDPGQTVLVIGGGNAAVDSARTALRLGTGKVTILYRRGLEQMPADREEIDEALAEGVAVEFLTAPAKMLVEDGRVKGLQCVKTKLEDVLGSGRPKPVNIEGSNFDIPADTVISAVGQQPDGSWKGSGLSLDVTSQNTISANEKTMLTKEKGVFAAGDVVSGPSTVVEAMASGKKAARAVDQFLSGGSQA